MRTIVLLGTGNRFKVNEEGTLGEMQMRCPVYFSSPGMKPDSETFTVYRGQLITHQIVRLSDQIPRKHLSVCLFLRESIDDLQHECPDLFCVSSSASDWAKFDEEAAHRLIDLILNGGKYRYSMAKEVS